jgi:hypothetical protein
MSSSSLYDIVMEISFGMRRKSELRNQLRSSSLVTSILNKLFHRSHSCMWFDMGGSSLMKILCGFQTSVME